MSRTRRAGLILSGIASALWGVVLIAFYAPAPEDGVSIGGAILAMLAFPLSMAGSVILLATLRGSPGLRGRAVRRRVAAGVTVVAMALLAAVFVLGPTGSLPEETTVALLISGIGAFLAAFALHLLPAGDA